MHSHFFSCLHNIIPTIYYLHCFPISQNSVKFSGFTKFYVPKCISLIFTWLCRTRGRKRVEDNISLFLPTHSESSAWSTSSSIILIIYRFLQPPCLTYYTLFCITSEIKIKYEEESYWDCLKLRIYYIFMLPFIYYSALVQLTCVTLLSCIDDLAIQWNR